MRFFYALHLVHEGTGLIIGYLSLVSLHFFHPITLAYVTSRVLRPPWDHEIRRYLWQSSLGQAFIDWLKYSRYYVLFYGRYFWEAFGLSLAWHIDVLMDFWVWRQFIEDIGFIFLPCTKHPYWGIFPHFEVTLFLSDLVRVSSETCFYSWDYHIPHHFGYSFEIRFGVSLLRHWSILHSNFLADYCWAENSWLMMSDSSFGCALDIHTRAYLLISLRFLVVLGYVAILFMVTEMLDGFWQILWCA